MNRSTLSRLLLFGGIFLAVWMLFGRGCGKDKGPNTAMVKDGVEVVKLPDGTKPGDPCTIETKEFRAVVDPIAGGLRSYQILGTKYVENGKQADLALRTTLDAETGKSIADYAPLRTYFRNELSENQVPGDLVPFQVEKKDGACVLTHETPAVVRITRTIRASTRPYELDIETTIQNLAVDRRRHAFSTSLFALQFKSQEGGILSRPSPNDIFQGACAVDGKVERKDKSSLREWMLKYGKVDFVSISSNYIGQAIVPLDEGSHCAVIAQERGVGTAVEQGLFRAVLAYAPRDLEPQGTASYKHLAFLGPKERDLLAGAGGGERKLDQLIDLGTFAFIAKFLVRFLSFVHGIIGSWGIAIILLTVTVRVSLMPLTLPQIRSSIAMRRLKPELDILNKKYEGEAQTKMLATSELYKKHGVNPLAGCLPALLQMPVWFALYTALQTAIELYHEKFAFWHDLSSPDSRFILPLVLGATMYLQQRVTPMQMDPAQQKIFMYFMPAMFTVFMLFLPAGLGVYMLTNSILGILQTVAVERYYASTSTGEVKVTQVSKELEKPKKKS